MCVPPFKSIHTSYFSLICLTIHIYFCLLASVPASVPPTSPASVIQQWALPLSSPSLKYHVDFKWGSSWTVNKEFIMKDTTGKDSSVTQTGWLGREYDGASVRSKALQRINSTHSENCRPNGNFHSRCGEDHCWEFGVLHWLPVWDYFYFLVV